MKDIILSTLIAHTHSVLGMDEQSIKNKFFMHHSETIVFRHKDETSERILEVRFENDHTTMSCKIGDDKICHEAFLFPDNIETFSNFINFAHSVYKYDEQAKQWILPVGYLRILDMQDSFCCWITQ